MLYSEAKSEHRCTPCPVQRLHAGSSNLIPPRGSWTPRLLLAAFAAVLCMLTACACQGEPKAGSNWQNVKALPLGATLEVKTSSQHLRCKLSSVTDDALRCHHGSGEEAVAVLQRTDIAWIKISRRGRSALIGAGIGGAGLGIAGFAATTGGGSFFGPNFCVGPLPRLVL